MVENDWRYRCRTNVINGFGPYCYNIMLHNGVGNGQTRFIIVRVITADTFKMMVVT